MKIHSRWAPTVATAVLFLVAVTGCIEFAQQTLTYRHDVARDSLLLYQNYRGIHGTDLPAILSTREQTQLFSVWRSQRTFFFDNWIAEFDLTSWRQGLAKPPADDLDDTGRAYDEALRRLVTLMLANTHISNGPFYHDAAGRLCGVQRVEICLVSSLVPAAEHALRTAFADVAARAVEDEGKRARFTRAAQDPAPLFVIQGNRITVRFPASPEEYEGEIKDPSGNINLQAFTRAGGTVTFADEMVTITFGREDSDRETLTLPDQPTTPDDNADVFVQDQFGIAGKFDLVDDAEQFFNPR